MATIPTQSSVSLDRLAAVLDALHPGLQYANLAIHGRRIRMRRRPTAPGPGDAARPDHRLRRHEPIITRPGLLFDRAWPIWTHCTSDSCSPVTPSTTTFPDIARIVPVGRILITHAAHEQCHRHGRRPLRVQARRPLPRAVDEPARHLERRPCDTGQPSGPHSVRGCGRQALNLPSSNHDWAQPGPAAVEETLRSRAHSQLLWTKNMLAPWLWHHARGKSTGDGRLPKRPQPHSLVG